MLGYAIFYRRNNLHLDPDNFKTVEHEASGTRLENLDKFTVYAIRVLAFTKHGNGVASKRVTIKTDEDGK